MALPGMLCGELCEASGLRSWSGWVGELLGDPTTHIFFLSISQGLPARGALAVALGPGGELWHLKFAEVKSIKGQKSVKIVI